MKLAYPDFIASKSQYGNGSGFDPVFIPDEAFDFQKSLIEWSVRMGRCAIFADCGLGKTLMQLAWAENVVRHTNCPVLLLTPIAVGRQTIEEAAKFGIDAQLTRNGDWTGDVKVWVTNYEQLHNYNPDDFAGVVGDESSRVKDDKTATKAAVTEFARTLSYRLLCTATAAPNDFWELGTSSEILGYLGWRDMITSFFKQETQKDHLGWGRTKYRFRGHAEKPFWSWVCSWARAIRRPSDIGGDDGPFVLPELIENEIVVEARTLRSGQLFAMPAANMQEEREERRRTLPERCERIESLAMSHDRPSAIWVTLNDEANELERAISDCKQVSGSMSDEEKEETFHAFASGQVKRIITKPKIGAWGLNWQHCSDVYVFPSHSYEQYYQLVRRCYRFGQKRPVTVTTVVSEGEAGISKSLKRKQLQCERMFNELVAHMNDSLRLCKADHFPQTERMPEWLLSTKA